MFYKTIFILLAIYSTTIEGEDREGWPGYNSVPEIKGWLKIHLEPADFDTARAKCREEGAQLLNPYIPEFRQNAIKLMNASSTPEKPVRVVYSLAKVDHVTGGGFVVRNDVHVYEKKHTTNCVVITPDIMLYRTECEDKLPFICYALNSDARNVYHSKLDDKPEQLVESPYRFEMQHYNPNI